MRSADKATLVDTVNGASLHTLTAGGALLIVDNCKIVYNLDSAELTGALTFTATDTAVFTILSRSCALITIGAFNNNA